MISSLSPRAHQLAGSIAAVFEHLKDLAKEHPHEVLVIVDMIRRHVDNAFPQAPMEQAP